MKDQFAGFREQLLVWLSRNSWETAQWEGPCLSELICPAWFGMPISFELKADDKG